MLIGDDRLADLKRKENERDFPTAPPRRADPRKDFAELQAYRSRLVDERYNLRVAEDDQRAAQGRAANARAAIKVLKERIDALCGEDGE